MSKLCVKKCLLRICYLLVLINNCLAAQEARQAVPPRCRETRGAQKRFFQDIRQYGHRGLVGTLSRHPSLVYARNDNNDTPLHISARAEKNPHSLFKVAEILLIYGAQVDALNNDGHTPLELALFEGHHEIAQVLVRNRARVNRRLPSGQTPLHWLIPRQLPNEFGLFYDLLDAGADVNAQDRNGETPLIYAVRAPYGYIITPLLLRRGARVDVTDRKGRMPLHIAARRGDIESLKALVAYGADVNAQNRNGEMPLNYAVHAPNGYIIIPLLLRHGARVDVPDKNGKMPLHIAARRGDIESLKALVAYGSDVNAADPEGKTALHYVICHSDNEYSRKGIIEALVSNGADLNAADPEGKTPLHYAKLGSYVTTLVTFGPNINIQDCDGLSPYYAAIRDGRLKVALVLLEQGAEVDSPDGDYGEEFGRHCLTLDVIAFYRAQRHRFRHLSGDMQPEDHMQIQTEAGNALLRFLAGEDIYSETHLPIDLNVMIVSFLLSPEAAANLQQNPTRLQVAKAWLRRWAP